jgi:hypothetical protein
VVAVVFPLVALGGGLAPHADAASLARVTIETSGPARPVTGALDVVASVHGRPKTVTFYVDGRRRSVARKPPFRLGGKEGVLDTAELAVGEHRISVRATFERGPAARDSTIVKVAIRRVPMASVASRATTALPTAAADASSRVATVRRKVATTELPPASPVTKAPGGPPASLPTSTPLPVAASVATLPPTPTAALTPGRIRGVNANIRNWATAPLEMQALGATWTREDYVVGGGWPKVMAAEKQGVHVLAILNPGDEDRVASPDLRDSTAFEIVNEPWLAEAGIVQNGWTAKSYAAAYVKMATKIRQLRPDATLLFSSEIAYSPWLRDCIKAEPTLPKLIDGISFHPYTQPKGGFRPENTGLAFERIDAAKADAKALGVDVPFWITEFGWNVGDGYSADEVGDLYQEFMQKVAARQWIAATFPYQLGSLYDAQPNGYGLTQLTDGGPVRLPAFDAVAATYHAWS